MSKIIKDVKVDWSWIGDTYSLLGFNIAITPSNGDPTSKTTAYATIKDNVNSYVFNNVVLDDTLQYTAWVQAIYNGRDSGWINTSNFVVADDGTSTIETKKSNIANSWTHTDDSSKFDGGNIYAGTVTADKINAYGLTIYNLDQSNLPSFSVTSKGEVSLSGNLKSFNYSSVDNIGWSISQDGNAVLNQAVVRGSMLLPNAGMTDQNNIRIWAGSGNPYSSWTTTISSASSIGTKTLNLTNVNGIVIGVNQLIKIGDEERIIISLNNKTVTLDSALTNAYSNGTTVTLTLLAPFAVSQDGTVTATKGNFGGTFTGNLDVGNIHITDTDPNSTPYGASFIMNTDNEERTVIKLQETDSYIDTKFAFGNNTDQYMLIDNDNGVININNNGLYINQFTNNLLVNSMLTEDTSNWTLTTWTRDMTLKLGEANSLKISRTGLSADSGVNAINDTWTNCVAGDKFTASIYAYTDNYSGIDGTTPKLVVDYYNGSTYLSASTVIVKPSSNNTWERFEINATAPANTTRVRIYIRMYRNGNLWVAKPQLEIGSVMTAHGVNISERKSVTIPNTINKPYIQFNENDYNFDIKSDNAFCFQSNTNAPTDFKFAKEAMSNSVNVLIDGSLEVNSLVQMGKLIMQKRTDANNQGIDFIFV